MALKPEQISGLREAFSAIAQPINDWLLQDAAERIAAAGSLAGEPAGKMTATAAYEIYRAKALGESQRELKKFLKRQLGLSNREIRRLFKQAARMSRDNDEERVGLTGGADIEQMTAAAIKLAQQDFTNLTQTLGMMAPGGKVLPLRQFYQKSMDFAFEQIFTGAADYETAIRQATTKMADAGVRTINYESGRATSLEAAVRRNMMGGMGLLDEQITQANHDALGCNGWEISAHANSAPDHEPIQGRQYSDREFKTLESRLIRRIGTLNCGHVKMPILLGINSPQYTEEQLRAFKEDNAKGITYEGKHYTGYEATQKQRQLECAQRVQKNRILVSRSTGDALRKQTAQIRLQMLSQHYKAFSKAAGLPLQQEQTWVAGFGPKQATKRQKQYDGIPLQEEHTKAAATDRQKKVGTSIENGDQSSYTKNNPERGRILTKDEALAKAKEFAEEYLVSDEVKDGKPSPSIRFIQRKLGYDQLPKVVSPEDFEAQKSQSRYPVLYRGISPFESKSGQELAEQYMFGELFGGQYHAYGRGTYFSPDYEVVKTNYAAQEDSVILMGVLAPTARVANYADVLKDFCSTGVPFKARTNKMEGYELLLSSVGEYASLKGYDAIAMNGYANKSHYIILNRGKVVINYERRVSE